MSALAVTPTVTKILVEAIRLDGGTQIRSAIDEARVATYREKYESGVRMPPPVVFYDGTTHWLADGFHRVAAVRAVGWLDIIADVRAGTRRDAILHAAGANEEHGAPRTNEDKRRAVETLLRDEEWAQWSDRKIAAVCRVGHKLVGSIRSSLAPGSSDEPRRYVTKHGTEAVMNTANIGRGPKCLDCGETDRAKFYAHKSSATGCQSRCKRCDNAKRAANQSKAVSPLSVVEPVEDRAPHPRKRVESHALVKGLHDAGFTVTEIAERTGLKKKFIHDSVRATRPRPSALAAVIQDAEVVAETWLARCEDPRVLSATLPDRVALADALAACRRAASRLIRLLKNDNSKEIADEASEVEGE